MFRRWLSSFIKRNKTVILKLARFIGSIILLSLLATAIMSGFKVMDNTSQTEDSVSIYKPMETVVEGKRVTKNEFDSDEEVIALFIKYCNENDLQSAYDMLSTNCRKYLYPTVEDFRSNYYDKLFTTKKEFNLQSWINNDDYHTYRVRLLEDILSTGEYSNSQKAQDYITVVKEDESQKINLNGYIFRQVIKKESSADSVKAYVVERNVFVDYEEYVVKIKNVSKNGILLDTGSDVGSILLVDENNVMYQAFKGNMGNLKEELAVGAIRTFKIRFNKTFTVDTKDKNIVFSDIVTDFKKYSSQVKYDEREKLSIEL